MKLNLQLPKTSIATKRIPTLIGIGVLVIGLIAGTVLFGNGTGVFAPRASAETTPKNIRITNVTDTSFTVSFMTDVPTIGFVKYGDSAKSLKLQTSDDRNQLSGSTAEFSLQHITVRGLSQNTTYYYVLGTGSGATFDNAGQPFSITTAKRSGAPAAAKTIYGSVTTESGAPADGAIVYIKIADAGDMSSLVKSSGSWAIPLSNARTPDGSGYAKIDDTTRVALDIRGKTASQKLEFTTVVKEAQPVVGLTFGSQPTASEPPAAALAPAETKVTTNDIATVVPPTTTEKSASASGKLTGLLDESVSVTESSTPAAEITHVDVDASESATVTTSQPKIIGKAPANTVITIEIHSETAINHQLSSNDNGEFEIDVAALGKTLEPGEHTITYSYTDPESGEIITKTKTFTVANTSTQLAQAQPYGTQNPYPIGGATSSASTATGSADSKGGSASDSATTSARSSMPSTTSGVPVSGSVGTTLALIVGGLFFIISGSWSFWIASQLAKEESTA